MTQLRFEQIEPIKLPLVKRFYKQHYPAGKAKSDELIIAAYSGPAMVAVVRFRHIEETRLLTGMVVDTKYRSQGIGAALMAYCQQQILRDQDYCFALEHLENFYCRFGFETTDTTNMPGCLQNLFKRYTQSGKSLKPLQYVA
ncbi:GNAT family N-acetyltransferase [Vibrio sp. SCSIO 43136]|uniref:GNAT family N-acetyltransferase n=1 Tax=Vibrio sp. SCSIO 43136 TaxID=2819101 RepID=UPI002076586C|nr:GNAT family N-acetyltransferase [Vibrio sp. SCSIO 43136]USD65414.1 GNAT family N-acetyltransferase [Vibrio sp. SCSIO 43136]